MNTGMQIKLIGEGFEPSRKTNTEIGRMLGVKRGEPCPNFMRDHSFTKQALEALDRQPMTLPVQGGGVVCWFDVDGELVSTPALKNEAQAMCCALHYLLTDAKTV